MDLKERAPHPEQPRSGGCPRERVLKDGLPPTAQPVLMLALRGKPRHADAVSPSHALGLFPCVALAPVLGPFHSGRQGAGGLGGLPLGAAGPLARDQRLPSARRLWGGFRPDWRGRLSG